MEQDWLGLSERVVVVTGAGGGIGRAVALGFARAGARVQVVDLNADAVDETNETIAAATGRPALVAVADIGDPASVARAATQLRERWGACDVLFNNAATTRPGPLESIDLADWERLLRVNLSGYLICSQAYGAGMIERGKGSIIHVSSIVADNPQPGGGAYSSAKAAVEMLGRQMAVEWGPKGIRSNTLAPGLIRTPLTEHTYLDADVVRRREAMIPARRIGAPEDIADVALWLGSDRSSYVTGQVLLVDGGFDQSLVCHLPGAAPTSPEEVR